MPRRKTICFVTGTRAEFGLMRTTLAAIGKRRDLKLQIVVTGMHLAKAHGQSIGRIKAEGWKVDAIVPWRAGSVATATGEAIAGLSRVFGKLRPDVVMVVGDRVEALAAATAAHLSGIAVAHVHGGDRALGQVDDSLRHAISKLAHIHFPATARSAKRLARLGEDAWRVRRMGSPAVDGIRKAAASWRKVSGEFPGLRRRRYALLVLHPIVADENLEFERAAIVAGALALATNLIKRIVIVYPNNDPGSGGIIRCWRRVEVLKDHFFVRQDLARDLFLGLLRDAAVLVGNSSSGIIEAGSFGTPVVDIGPRQQGRERRQHVRNVPYNRAQITRLVRLQAKHPRRGPIRDIYGPGGAGAKITNELSKLSVDARLMRKIISY